MQKFDVLKEEIGKLPEEHKGKNTARELHDHLHHPVLHICGWCMESAAVDSLIEKFGLSSQRSVTQSFAAMGITKKTENDVVYFAFDNDSYKQSGYKLHKGADEGTIPNIIFVQDTPP